MIDIHAHILPNVDDGAGDYAEGLAIARDLVDCGVEKVISTPHFLGNGPRLTPEETKEKTTIFQEKVDKEGIPLKILPGAEVFITVDLGKMVDNGEVPTLNETRYLLLELPLEKVPSFTENVFFDLKVLGYIPVIAHPERNADIQKNPNLLFSWVNDGIKVQINAGSLMGYYGKRARKAAKILLRKQLSHFLASDAHSPGKNSSCLRKGLKIVRRTNGKIRAKGLVENAKRLIENKELLPSEPSPYVPSGKLTGLVFGEKF